MVCIGQPTSPVLSTMAKIEFPIPLKRLLEDSDLQAPIRALADRVGEILADNKLPFFPDYTDHGVDHINRVLESEVELIPKTVWEESERSSSPRLLTDADAAVIIGATLLHDIAMHLRIDGFRELVGRESRFKPLPWFRESHEGHTADIPWHELWEDYARQARRFSDLELTNIIGEESARIWKFHGLPENNGQWETNHHLIVGEFIRRHHARLAHEIAIYGFPGLPVGAGENQFPATGKEEGHPLMRLADLIGLTARSHGTSLRLCKSYLEAGHFIPERRGLWAPLSSIRWRCCASPITSK
jgi:molecular chaperone HtpG